MHSLNCVCLSAVQWTVAHQAPLHMEFPRQKYWGRLPFPTPGDLPDLEIKLTSLASPKLASGFFFFFTTSVTWEALVLVQHI